MGFKEGSILFDNPTGTYQPGDSVTGRVIFELVKVKEVRAIKLKVKGFCKVHWTTEESRTENGRTENHTVNHDSYEEYIKMQIFLVGSDNGSVSLNPGKYDYPFRFSLPARCPASFDGPYGHVRYQVKAVADRAFRVDQDLLRAFTVTAPIDLNTLNCGEPVNLEFDQSYCCWCVSSGSSSSLVKLPASGFCPGQDIPLEISCSNPSNVELEYISFAVKRVITYRASYDTKTEESSVLYTHKGPVPAHTDRAWTVPVPVPQMDLYNLNGCSYIQIRHYYKVVVEPGGCHESSDASGDIIFGTIPLGSVQDQPMPVPGQLPTTTVNYPPSAVVEQPLLSHGIASPYPPPPYPGTPGRTSPYPLAQNVSPYPSNPPYPVTPGQNVSPYPPAPGQNVSPYPTPGQNISPYPVTPGQNLAPNPVAPGQNLSPYPVAPGQNLSPYPVAPGQNLSPYPIAPGQNVSPYPTPGQIVSPNPVTPGQNLSPYPVTPGQNVSPYPAASPYPVANDVLVKSAEPGFVNPRAAPALPPGAAVPYPPRAASPFATASAPEPSTPDSDGKKAEYNTNSSPFNPDFLTGDHK